MTRFPVADQTFCLRERLATETDGESGKRLVVGTPATVAKVSEYAAEERTSIGSPREATDAIVVLEGLTTQISISSTCRDSEGSESPNAKD
jgi:hypothetical protein